MSGKGIKVDEPATVQARVAGEVSCETREDAALTDYLMQLFVPASLKITSATPYRSGLSVADTTKDLTSYTSVPLLFVGDKTIAHIGAEFSTIDGAAILIPVLFYDNSHSAILSVHRDLSFAAGFYQRSASGKYIAPFQEVLIGAAKYMKVIVKYLQSGALMDIIAGVR